MDNDKLMNPHGFQCRVCGESFVTYRPGTTWLGAVCCPRCHEWKVRRDPPQSPTGGLAPMHRNHVAGGGIWGCTISACDTGILIEEGATARTANNILTGNRVNVHNAGTWESEGDVFL